MVPWPTSAITISPPVVKENRHGLRRPCASCSTSSDTGSSRSSLPSRDVGFWACPYWLFEPPPSPVASHSLPSGPKRTCPPLWFAALECWIASSGRPLPASATFGFEAERRNSRIWISPVVLLCEAACVAVVYV